MNCLICARTLTDLELPECGSRHEDGAPVCPRCMHRLKTGDPDALDIWFDKKLVRG